MTIYQKADEKDKPKIPLRESLDQYFHEISEPKLLSGAEEIEFAQMIEGCYRNLVDIICDYNIREKAWGFSLLLEELKRTYEPESQNIKKESEPSETNEAYVVISRLEDIIVRSNAGREEKKKESVKAKEWLFELLYWSGYNPDPEEEEGEISGEKTTIEMYRGIIFSTIENIKGELETAFNHYDRMVSKARNGVEEALYLEKRTITAKVINEIRKNSKLISEHKDELAERNLRLVVNRAKYYQKRGLSLKDLVSAGNTGLMKAVEKFDYRRGHKFSTYATWQIRNTIGKAISDYGKIIRLPTNVLDDLNKWFETETELFMKLQRSPTDREIAEIAIKKLSKRRQKYETSEGLTKKIRSTWRVTGEPIALDREVETDNSTTLKELIADPQSPDPEECSQYFQLVSEINLTLSQLTETEEKVIMMRFGIGEYEDHTLEEVGQRFNLTRERIRQIEAKALKRLRHPNRSKKLKTFW
jgi:RNA polymerase sigma factor (sigma-70 family)